MMDIKKVEIAYIFATQAHVVNVEGDHCHGGGKGDEADGDAVVESCKSQCDILNKVIFSILTSKKSFSHNIVNMFSENNWDISFTMSCGQGCWL